MEAIIIEAEVIEALRSCFDPEIPVNIYELGLIYDVKVDPSGAVGIRRPSPRPVVQRRNHCLQKCKLRRGVFAA